MANIQNSCLVSQWALFWVSFSEYKAADVLPLWRVCCKACCISVGLGLTWGPPAVTQNLRCWVGSHRAEAAPPWLGSIGEVIPLVPSWLCFNLFAHAHFCACTNSHNVAIAFAWHTLSIAEFLCRFFGYPVKKKFIFCTAVHCTVLNVDDLGFWEVG